MIHNDYAFLKDVSNIVILNYCAFLELVQLKKIKIGRDLGTHLEIVQGLSPDDEVIVNPSDSLASGQKVKVEDAQNEKSR